MSPGQPIKMSFASVSQDAFKFPKLNGQNYAIWSIHMQSLLQSRFLWLVVKGTEECPPTLSANEAAKRNYLDWVSRDEATKVLCGVPLRKPSGHMWRHAPHRLR